MNEIKVVLAGDAGTIAAMKWLRDNDAERMYSSVWFYDEYKCLQFIVTPVGDAPWHVLEMIDRAANIDGMIRFGNPEMGWHLGINDNWYYMSYHR